MPVPVPRLDDRGFADLASDLVARIPAHTPEWTDPRPGDPGRTLIDLVAWLGDTILYRANLIPERNRLAFLRLLDLPMRAALAASGFITVVPSGPGGDGVIVASGSGVTGGPLPCETAGELEALPVEGRCFLKRRPDADERARLDGPLRGLAAVYRARLGAGIEPYVTTPAFIKPVEGAGLDIAATTLDRSLWLALLTPDGVAVDVVRAALGHGSAGARALNVALAPSVLMPADFAEWGPAPVAVRAQWSISTGRWDGSEPQYRALDVVADGTAGLTRAGVVRLVLPDSGNIGLPVDASDAELNGGVGARPPRIDDARTAARVVAWIRLRLDAATSSLPLAWVALNAVRVDQLVSVRNQVVGAGDGRAAQEVHLSATNVDRASFQLAVEEPGRGFVGWRMIDELGAAGRDDRVFRLDAETGVLRFGDGMRGRLPPTGGRLLVATMRSGGGSLGNMPAGALSGLSGLAAPVTVAQPLPLSGGQDAESLDQAERRLPARLAHGDRAVTPDDFRQLALETPAAPIARAEVLPRFKPQQRLDDIPGVVSVMVIPPAQRLGAPNPRPDRTTLERVHAQLDTRRTLGCELYVIGVDYVPCALSVAVRLADGAERDATLRAVRTALQIHCHPLAPGGRQGAGWALGDAVREGELEVVVARVPGVAVVGGVRVFRQGGKQDWHLASRDARAQTRLDLARWQLPELQEVIVEDADAPSEDGTAFTTVADDGLLIAIPTVPGRC